MHLRRQSCQTPVVVKCDETLLDRICSIFSHSMLILRKNMKNSLNNKLRATFLLLAKNSVKVRFCGILWSFLKV